MAEVSWKNSKFWYPLWILSHIFFTVSEENHLHFLQKLSFDKIWLKNKSLPISKWFWVLFISSSGSHINFSKFQNPLDLFSRVISSWIGEHARNWAKGLKTQRFKVLCFEPNYRGRLNMTSEGTPWNYSINQNLRNWFIHDSGEEHASPPILSLSHIGSSKFN